MHALATEDETLSWVKTRVGVFDSDDHADFPGSAQSSWDYTSGNPVGASGNAPDHIVQLEPVAELDGAGNVVSRFVYATKGHSPDYMLRDGSTYRIVSDHLGSPRLVIDVDSGAVVQRMDFDEWGVVTLDTNPGWQPFGFAGGLLDLDTGLTRFGARDYAAAEGRWTAKDAAGLGAAAGMMFVYAFNDPVNLIDPTGRAAQQAVQTTTGVLLTVIEGGAGLAGAGGASGLAFLGPAGLVGGAMLCGAGIICDPQDLTMPPNSPEPSSCPAPQPTPPSSGDDDDDDDDRPCPDPAGDQACRQGCEYLFFGANAMLGHDSDAYSECLYMCRQYYIHCN